MQVARLFLFLGVRPIAADKAPSRIVEIDTLAAALPVAGVVKQCRACIVAAYPQDETAIGAGDRSSRHGARLRASGGRPQNILKWEMSEHTRFRGD